MYRVLAYVFDKRPGAFAYLIKTTVFALALSALPLIGLLSTPSSQSVREASPNGLLLIAALVVAPLFENFCMIIVIEFMTLFPLRSPVVVTLAIVGLLAGLAHLAASVWMGIAAAIMFPTMAFSYMTWSELPVAYRYAITVAQHVLANTPASIAIAFAMMQSCK